MGTLRFFLADITYKIVAGRAIIYMYGKTEDGKQVCVKDASSQPYFYVVPEQGRNDEVKERLEGLTLEKGRVTKVETLKKNWFEKQISVLLVTADLPPNVPALREHIRDWESVKRVLEADILFVRRYLVDRQLTPMTLLEATCEPSAEGGRVACFDASEVKQASDASFTQPKILAIDIETYNPLGRRVIAEEHPIIMLSLYGKGMKKVITWKNVAHPDVDVEVVDSEAALLERTKQVIDEYKPDVLVGYYSDGFDLPYIRTRANKYKIKLDLGWDHSEMRMSGRDKQSCHFTGLVHIDVLRFIRQVMGRSMKTDTFTLDAVAEELLGEKKAEVNIEQLADSWEKGDERLAEFAYYNLKDSRLTHDLLVKVLPNMIEMVKIIGLPIWDINRMTFSQYVEWFIIRQAFVANELVPNRPGFQEQQRRQGKRFKGAFVYEPTPGMYEDIAVFDYRSLYPTIIASHNISPGTLNCNCCEGKDVVPDSDENRWYCKKRRGFISKTIEELIARRARIKGMLKSNPDDPLLRARSESLKVMANSFYGYLGFSVARWYCFECGQSVTAWGRHHIHAVIDQAKKEGFEVLYSDSLPGDRRVFVRDMKGDIKLISLSELYENRKELYETLAYTKGKIVTFAPVNRVIRHRMKKKSKLLRIRTKYGSTVVTDQHSVYSYDRALKLADAGKLRKGDNLVSLTRPLFAVKYKEGHVFDMCKMDLGKEYKELMLYKDNNEFPGRKGTCPYCKKKAHLASHVFARHHDRRAPMDARSKLCVVGGINARTGKIPRFWKLDLQLAWLLGFYCVDGSVSNRMTKTGRKHIVSFGNQNQRLIRKVKNILDKRLGADLKIITSVDKRTGRKMFYYRVQRIPFVMLIKNGFGAGQGSENKAVPSFIFASEPRIRRAFMRGYLNGDGTKQKGRRYATHFIKISTKSKSLAQGLDFLFKSLYHGKNANKREIKYVSWGYRPDKPDISTLRVQSAKKCRRDFCLAEITDIKQARREKFVYDLEVAGCHNFVDAEGMILVHNTDSVFLNLKGRTKDDAIKFVDRINADLPELMELEFESFFPAGLFVATKGTETGAKKRYALLDEKGKLKIRGFEVVRRNVSPVAKRIQERVLLTILKEKNPEKAKDLVQETIDKLHNNELPIEDVTITTAITKEIGSYETIGPHVAAAKLMQKKGRQVGAGTRVQYVVTKGKGIIRDRVKLPEDTLQEDYDGEYYVKNQVIPAVEKIFEVVGIEIKKSTTQDKGQATLGSF